MLPILGVLSRPDYSELREVMEFQQNNLHGRTGEAAGGTSAADYLTQRLVETDPAPYRALLVQTRRKSLFRGFLVGFGTGVVVFFLGYLTTQSDTVILFLS